MNLRESLLEEHSRLQAEKITQWIGADPERITQLISLFLQDEYRVVQRAARVVSNVAQAHPGMMLPHITLLVGKLQDTTAHIAVKRNIYRVMQYLELPESIHADLMNHCFGSLANPREALAVRAFAMSILARLSMYYPEIAGELRLLIEEALQQQPAPSFRSRAAKVLRELRQRHA